jgi:two-component system chemotaxis response regulator CheB
MASRLATRVLAVGTSAGGVEALVRLVGALPADFPAPVLVVLHVPSFSASNLPAILDRAGPLKAEHARDHDPLVVGRIYVAPPDFHLLATAEDVRVVRGPHENNHRPAIDPLFRSVALAFGPAAIALVLTGTLDDGAAGVVAVSERGGTVVVQDPDEALYPGMPEHAIAADHPAHIATLAEIPGILDRLAREPVSTNGKEGQEMDDDQLDLEQSFAAFDLGTLHADAPGDPAPYSCPACGGTLWEAPDESMVRFRCRVGHAYGADSLLGSQADRMDEALWTALRALEERRSLCTRMAKRMRSAGVDERAEGYETSAAEAARQAQVLRDILLGRGSRDVA